LSAGVFGGSRSTPLINYYEHSTFLTLNHAHTALFGAFGLLAIGLIYFCLRYATADRAPFSDSLGLAAFWLYNARLILWIALNFFPVGWPQLDALFQHGLAYVRSLEFYDTPVLWQWLRFLGDALCRRRAVDGIRLHRQAHAVVSEYPGAVCREARRQASLLAYHQGTSRV